MTWTAAYSALTATEVGWQQLSSVTDSAGVDFTMKVNDQFPLKVNDARHIYVIDQEESV